MDPITSDQIKVILPDCKNPNDVTTALNLVLEKYEINTVNRVAGFLAQCGHESGQFNITHENLNYSTQGLRGTFPKYFPNDGIANTYARNPEKIGNRVYANRMGNGDETSGDGYKYRGRGAIQLTGHDNYAAFGKSIGKEMADTITYLETLPGAIESACWFWKNNHVNATCDADDIVAMTKKINGGTIGLDERKELYESAKEALA